MKTLYLVRHAKSDWGNEAIPDIDRPLNARGYRDAHNMGERLFAAGHVPGLLISSPAIRAYSTALIFARKFGYPSEAIRLKESIYEASVFEMTEQIKTLPPECAGVMLFGHNPTFTLVAEKISGATIGNMPTCSVVCIRFDTKTWSSADQGELMLFDFPKNAAGV